MHIKQSLKFQINNFKTASIVILVLYSISAIFLISVISPIMYKPTGMSTSTPVLKGMDSLIIIAMIIIGLSGFKKNFLMHLQNSVSRKTFFTTEVISTVISSAAFAVFNTLYTLIMNFIAKVFINTPNMWCEVRSIFSNNLGDYEGNVNFIWKYNNLFDILWANLSLFIFLTIAFLFCSFIACALYRANTLGKTLIITAFPALSYFGLLIVNKVYKGYFLRDLDDTFYWIRWHIQDFLCLSPQNCALSLSVLVLIAILILTAFWLVLRKAPIKK